jgi:hypothetical protein
MFTATRARRERDRDQRRAAANRRIGHELAWWYFWRPYITGGLLLLVAGVGVRWLWTNVDHATIAGVAGGVGVALLAAYLVWWLRQRSPYANPRRYTRTSAMHFVGLAGVCLAGGSMVMWAVGA